MRIFVYKTFFLFFILFIFYKLTIGSLINSFEKKFYHLASKENIELQKSLLRNKIEILLFLILLFLLLKA